MTEARILTLSTPLTREVRKDLRAGDRVLLSGTIYAARDAAHRRMTESLRRGEPLPFDLRDQVVYYAGPAPTPPGRAIGPVGPTTSGRMDPSTPALLNLGLGGMIGKGRRSPEVLEALRRHGAVYFGATGGAAALLARSVQECVLVAYEDLGPEAILRLRVEGFPAVVVVDPLGTDLYDVGPREARRALGYGD